MKKIVWASALMFLLVVPVAAALADTITLDGVANATWSDNPNTYLYVAHADSSGYYYQWQYGAGSLPWTSVQDLVDDLSNQVLDKAEGKKVDGNWKIESGGNPFNPNSGGTVWKDLVLPAGRYTLRLASDSQAYNLQGYLWPGETPANHPEIWNCYIQLLAEYLDGSGHKTGGTANFSFGNYQEFSTESEALDIYRAYVSGMQIDLAQQALVHFYINDYNSVDNTHSVSLDINGVPLPATLPLLGSGLALLLAGRRWRRHKMN